MDIDKPIIVMCGSGVVAPILVMSLHRLGQSNWKLYQSQTTNFRTADGGFVPVLYPPTT